MAEAVKYAPNPSNNPSNNSKQGKDEWSTVQYKRRKIINRRGVAQPLEQFNFKAAERKISLYVSRVHKETTPGDIEAFIKYKTDLNVQVYKINKINNEFNAFKVIVPLNSVDLFLNDNGDRFWPADIVFRKFWERKQVGNKRSLKRSLQEIVQLCNSHHIIALQETWLFPHDLGLLNTIHKQFGSHGVSAVDTEQGMVRGRPYGE
ncbi:hypothetical protein HF086_016193 [Spodoptera exigua]|uniref:Uncharacterized protein n=1 Tax=Spodoptera exigua TaxID=7107 RepID=A0A922SGP8_SPOEX|nr:hypothetical protein HF086_016193 [Spodoptera exigua]